MNVDPVPPNSREAEAAVLGSIIIRPERFPEAAEIISEQDFYSEHYRSVWRVVVALVAARRPIDEVLIVDALAPTLGKDPAWQLIGELGGAVATPSLAAEYARTVRDYSTRRRLSEFGKALNATAMESGHSPARTADMLACAEFDLAQIAARREAPRSQSAEEILATEIWGIENRKERGLPTGFPTLDRFFAGFEPGHLTIVGGRTSRGKTTFSLNIASRLAFAGRRIAFISTEQGEPETWARLLACEARVDTFEARRRGLSEGERTQLATAANRLKELPLRIRYRPGLQPSALRLECKRLAAELGGLDLVIVDYLGLMRGDRHERERWIASREIVVALKQTAGELGLPIIVLSQLNRDANEKEPPVLANLRDTGASEEHASTVFFLWTPPTSSTNGIMGGETETVEILIAKQRNGVAFRKATLLFNKAWGRFECA